LLSRDYFIIIVIIISILVSNLVKLNIWITIFVFSNLFFSMSKECSKFSLTFQCCPFFCSACPRNLQYAATVIFLRSPSDVCTTCICKVRPLKIPTNHPLLPYSSGRGSEIPKMIFSLLPFSLLLQLSFLVLIPKD